MTCPKAETVHERLFTRVLKGEKGIENQNLYFFCNWGFLGFTTNFIIDFLKVLLIFFPGCSDRASLAKNFWEVDLPQVYVIKYFS